jgi:hypothetical protein
MRKLTLSTPADRLIGFTIPKAGVFYICGHDEVWRVAIGAAPGVQVTGLEPYKFVEGRADFLGLVFEGFSANQPLLRAGQNEIGYGFDPKMDFVAVRYTVAGQSGKIEFRTLSGDWFAASLSDDGRHLVLAEPYGIALYEAV